jgi:lipopolysaccharide transport system ATP-binding protein
MKEENEIAIRVTGLSKKYRIGEASLGDIFNPFSFFKKKQSIEDNKEFYALKDVSFEIKKGEAVGIIGRNGAGKSTLLKILSRITEPTEGKVEIFGTVASVLEIGMGFHPELTGRENVYLSGAMLGIPKKKIAEKFDEIVEFAGVEKFIDTPVKHYSSGMYVRLAFSVVANIDADILLFDEVLSVGDLAFQMKSEKKIRELIEQKKTVLLVSHNMNDIISICNKSILFNDASLMYIGSLEVVCNYFNLLINNNNFLNPIIDINNTPLTKEWSNNDATPGDNVLKIRKFYILNETRKGDFNLFTNDIISINVEFEKNNNCNNYDIGIVFSNFNNQFLITHVKNSILNTNTYMNQGYHKLKVIIPENMFSDVPITVGFIVLNSNGFQNFHPDIFTLKFQLTEEKSEYYSMFPKTTAPLLPNFRWEIF